MKALWRSIVLYIYYIRSDTLVPWLFMRCRRRRLLLATFRSGAFNRSGGSARGLSRSWARGVRQRDDDRFAPGGEVLRTEQRLLGVGLPGCLFGVLGLYGFRERDTGCRPKVVSFARATPHGPRRARALRRRYVHRSNARGACGVTGRLTRNRTTGAPGALLYRYWSQRAPGCAPEPDCGCTAVPRSHAPRVWI